MNNSDRALLSSQAQEILELAKKLRTAVGGQDFGTSDLLLSMIENTAGATREFIEEHH